MSNSEGQDKRPQVSVRLGNPYTVESLTDLKDSENNPLPVQETTLLCRCGHSDNKPYCDGSHLRVGFIGEKEADRVPDQVDEYAGPTITIVDNRGVCSHAGFCTDNLPSVFRMNEEPWIDAAGATIEAIIAQIEQCPSGALSYKVDGVRHQKHGGQPTINVKKDGPYYTTGGVGLTDDQDSTPETTDHYALCRCGQSKNKPFCNGAHWNGFEDSGTWKGSK